MLKTIAVSLAAAVTGGLLFTTGQSEASGPEQHTEKRTLAFIRALEREDLAAVARFQHPEIVLTHPITFSGNQEPDIVFTGHEETLGYFRGMFADMAEIDFDDTRVSVTEGGTASFVQTTGDFTAADGRPYRNVYLSRLEWTPDGRLKNIDDYYNPITVCKNFPENPLCGLQPSATAAVTGEANRSASPTEKRTLAFLDAIEREDLAAAAGFPHPDMVLTHPFSLSGNQEPDAVFTGRDQVLDYLRGLFAGMSRIAFDDIRVSVTEGGTVSFVETRGDFTTADGRPYRNVYVLRLEWTPGGRLLRADEYYNPVIACQTFDNPACDR